MRIWPLLVLAALAVAGCSDPPAAPDSQPVPCDTGLAADGTCPPPPEPQPVAISDGGDLGNGVQKEWAWDVAPGYERFSVQLTASGAQGAPVYNLADYHAQLFQGNKLVAEAGCEGGCQQGGMPTPACVLCWSVPGWYDTEDDWSGAWHLSWRTGPNLGGYDVGVTVSYGPNPAEPS